MQRTRTNSFLWLLVLIVPGMCVVFGDWIVSLTKGSPTLLETEPDVLVLQFLLAASPFFVLALMSSSRTSPVSANSQKALRAALSGILVTLLLWALYYYDAIARQNGGANIGLGLLMLASPSVVALAMFLGFRLSDRKGTAPA